MKKLRKITALSILLAFGLATFPLDVLAKGGGRNFGGGYSGGSRSFSGGSSSFSSPSRSFGGSSTFSSPSRSSGGWSGSSPSKPSGGGGFLSSPSRPSSPSAPSAPSSTSPSRSWFSSPSDTTRKPAIPSSVVDSAGAKAQQAERSRQKFDEYNRPKAAERGTSQTTTATTSRPYTHDPKDQKIKDLKRELNYQQMRTREERQRRVYADYWSRPAPTVVYNDGFSPWFWLWLMDRPHYRDQWVYHNYDRMDPARLAELKRNDADLDNRLRALEAQGVKRDPSYVPPEVDRDLVYSDDQVKRVYEDKNTSRIPWGWIFFGIAMLGLGYFVFFVRAFPRRA